MDDRFQQCVQVLNDSQCHVTLLCEAFYKKEKWQWCCKEKQIRGRLCQGNESACCDTRHGISQKRDFRKQLCTKVWRQLRHFANSFLGGNKYQIEQTLRIQFQKARKVFECSAIRWVKLAEESWCRQCQEMSAKDQIFSSGSIGCQSGTEQVGRKDTKPRDWDFHFESTCKGTTKKRRNWHRKKWQKKQGGVWEVVEIQREDRFWWCDRDQKKSIWGSQQTSRYVRPSE